MIIKLKKNTIYINEFKLKCAFGKAGIRTKVKEGSQPNQTVRIRGKGMPKKDGTYGDLYIQFKPYTPESIDKRIIKYIRENKNV